MEKVIEPFDEIKFSALSKSKHINQFVKNVTIGPNRTFIQEEEEQSSNSITTPTKPRNVSKVVLCRPHNNNGTNLIINQLRSELDKQRQNKVKEAVNKHIDCLKQFSAKQELETKHRTLLQQQLLINKVQQQELQIVNALEQHERDALVQHQQMVKYYKELADRKKRYDLELEEKEKKKQQINSILEKISVNQIEFRSVYQEISNTLKGYKYLNQLKVALGDVSKHFKEMPERMEEIVNECRNGVITENDCMKTEKLVQDIKGLLEVVKEKVAQVNKAEEKPPPVAETVSSVSIASQQSSTSSVVATVLPSPSLQSVQVEKFISKPSLKIYTELQAYKESFEASFNDLINEPSLKQFRFECKKAVNIPVNSISAVSPEHLTDKYDRLAKLLSGRIVDVAGTHVCAAKHPQGIAYCKNFLANKFVLQGDLMISGKPEAAFAYASVIVALWNDFPDFGKLLIAHFHAQCSYLVPIYHPRIVGQTDEEFYQSQGYLYSEGVVEKQDKFLKRMGGIMRLYASIIITRPKRGQSTNPHGLNEGWRWLAAFVNLEPKPDITATMLQVFLETAGSTLDRAYKKSFKKLMVYVCKVYLPIIQRIDSGGPVARLEVLLQNYMILGHFQDPNGVLPNNFW